jgi:uncharacterized protein YegP (UPF0339 family)
MIKVQSYTKKPVTIEAVQFTGGAEQATEIIDWVLANGGTARYHEGPIEGIAVDTIDGGVSFVYVGSWMLRGTQGEFYPCVNEAFEASFEKDTRYVELYEDEAGEWRYRAFGGNHEQIGKPEEGFASKGNAKRALRDRHPGIRIVETK